MSTNPNKNILNFVVTAPSLSQPLVSQFQSTKDIIIDITNAPIDPTSAPPTQQTNLTANYTLSNIYPVGSVFTQITGSPVIDPNQPYQMIILYDINNQVLENNINNYPRVKKIKSFFSKTTDTTIPISNTTVSIINKNSPSYTGKKSDYTFIYIGVAICLFFIMGGGISFSFTPTKNTTSTSGGNNRYLDYGE
jgi:hypothetical protein